MSWIEISVEADGESAEAIAEVLADYGHQGVAIERIGPPMDAWEDNIPPAEKFVIKAYMPADEHAADKQNFLRDAIRYMNLAYPIAEPTFRTIEEENWAEAWKVHYKPIRLGKRIYIRPSWVEADDIQENDVVLALDPGMAFGTGTHPSTQLCLIATEEILEAHPHLEVLDLGCGSGILSIAAILLGATRALALDIDELAVKVTRENAERNHVASRIHSQVGSLETVLHSARRFDLALVNILAKIIIPMCEQGLGQMIRPGGIGVFGGMIDTQADEVEAALRQTGLEPYKRLTSGDWVVMVARRPH